MIIPATIRGKKSKIVVHVVNSNILLLIKRPAMTNLGMMLDITNHKMIDEGKTFQIGL